MMKRIAAIIGIFACTCVCWMILGTSIFYRTNNLGPVLSSRVGSTWGTEHGQKPPSVTYYTEETKTIEVEEKGKRVEKIQTFSIPHDIPMNSSKVNADFNSITGKRDCCGSARTKWPLGGPIHFRI